MTREKTSKTKSGFLEDARFISKFSRRFMGFPGKSEMGNCCGQKWHPDRCSASGNSKSVEEAKKKFQAIQEAYSGNFTLIFS